MLQNTTAVLAGLLLTFGAFVTVVTVPPAQAVTMVAPVLA
jgi:hypothetical protein